MKNSNTPEALATKAAYRQAHDAYCREKEERERGAVLPLLTASEEREQASKHAREKADENYAAARNNIESIAEGIRKHTEQVRLKGEKMADSSYDDWVKLDPCAVQGSTEQGCVPADSFLPFLPIELTQEIPTYTWEVPHTKCEPTLGLAYAAGLALALDAVSCHGAV